MKFHEVFMVLEWVIFSISLICFGLGIYLPLITINIDVLGENQQIIKSVIQSLFLFWDSKSWVPFLLIGFFSLILPIGKFILALWSAVSHRRKHKTPKLFGFNVIDILRKASKYQFLDCFVIIFLLSLLNGGAITSEIHLGFYFFLSYCCLSVLSAEILFISQNKSGIYSRNVKPSAVIHPIQSFSQFLMEFTLLSFYSLIFVLGIQVIYKRPFMAVKFAYKQAIMMEHSVISLKVIQKMTTFLNVRIAWTVIALTVVIFPILQFITVWIRFLRRSSLTFLLEKRNNRIIQLQKLHEIKELEEDNESFQKNELKQGSAITWSRTRDSRSFHDRSSHQLNVINDGQHDATTCGRRIEIFWRWLEVLITDWCMCDVFAVANFTTMFAVSSFDSAYAEIPGANSLREDGALWLVLLSASMFHFSSFEVPIKVANLLFRRSNIQVEEEDTEYHKSEPLYFHPTPLRNNSNNNSKYKNHIERDRLLNENGLACFCPVSESPHCFEGRPSMGRTVCCCSTTANSNQHSDLANILSQSPQNRFLRINSPPIQQSLLACHPGSVSPDIGQGMTEARSSPPPHLSSKSMSSRLKQTPGLVDKKSNTYENEVVGPKNGISTQEVEGDLLEFEMGDSDLSFDGQNDLQDDHINQNNQQISYNNNIIQPNLVTQVTRATKITHTNKNNRDKSEIPNNQLNNASSLLDSPSRSLLSSSTTPQNISFYFIFNLLKLVFILALFIPYSFQNLHSPHIFSFTQLNKDLTAVTPDLQSLLFQLPNSIGYCGPAPKAADVQAPIPCKTTSDEGMTDIVSFDVKTKLYSFSAALRWFSGIHSIILHDIRFQPRHFSLEQMKNGTAAHALNIYDSAGITPLEFRVSGAIHLPAVEVYSIAGVPLVGYETEVLTGVHGALNSPFKFHAVITYRCTKHAPYLSVPKFHRVVIEDQVVVEENATVGYISVHLRSDLKDFLERLVRDLLNDIAVGNTGILQLGSDRMRKMRQAAEGDLSIKRFFTDSGELTFFEAVLATFRMQVPVGKDIACPSSIQSEDVDDNLNMSSSAFGRKPKQNLYGQIYVHDDKVAAKSLELQYGVWKYKGKQIIDVEDTGVAVDEDSIVIQASSNSTEDNRAHADDSNSRDKTPKKKGFFITETIDLSGDSDEFLTKFSSPISEFKDSTDPFILQIRDTDNYQSKIDGGDTTIITQPHQQRV